MSYQSVVLSSQTELHFSLHGFSKEGRFWRPRFHLRSRRHFARACDKMSAAMRPSVATRVAHRRPEPPSQLVVQPNCRVGCMTTTTASDNRFAPPDTVRPRHGTKTRWRVFGWKADPGESKAVEPPLFYASIGDTQSTRRLARGVSFRHARVWNARRTVPA